MAKYIVALNSFRTGARKYFAGDRYVAFKAKAVTFSEASEATAIAKSEQERLGNSVVMEIIDVAR